MSNFLPFIVSGLASGALYGLAGTGLVLTYKTSGIFNFGYGAIATIAAYIFYFLHYDHGWDWKLSVVIAIAVAGPLLGWVLEIFTRHLAPQRIALKIVGTVGIVLLVQGLATVKYGSQTIRVLPYLPGALERVKIGGTVVTYQQITIFVISALSVFGFYLFFRRSRSGMAMRSVVDDPDLVGLHGVNAVSVRRTASVIGSTFAALTGVLILPIFGLDAIVLTLLILQAVGAAAVGSFSSIPLTFVGGLLIGVVSDLSKKYVVTVPELAGIPSSLPFIFLFVVLLLLPKRRLVPPSRVENKPPLPWTAPVQVRVVMGVLVVGFLFLVPTFVDTKLSFWTTGVIQGVLLLSLGLLVRTSGQVSLCHAAFAGIGAAAFSQFRVDHGMPWVVALLLGALVVVPVAAIVAIPAIRLSGLYLALATFAFGIMIERLFYGLDIVFTSTTLGRVMPRPSVGRSDEGFYYVSLIALIAIALFILWVHKARLGRLLRGLSDSPTALATSGLSVNVTRVLVFCLSGFLAAIAGILYGVAVRGASSGDLRYQSFTSLVLICQLALAPFAAPWYAVIAVIGAVIPGYLTGENTTHWMNALFGLFAIMVALQGGPPHMDPKLRRLFERVGRRGRQARQERAAVRPVAPIQRITAGDESGVEVSNLTVRFGGLVAVNSLSVGAPTGRITGLIGPNGAGKTTTFNVCSGLVKPSSGRVILHGKDVSRLGPAARADVASAGPFSEWSCAKRSASPRTSRSDGSRRWPVPRCSHRSWDALGRRVWSTTLRAALELCGIMHLADLQAGSLSTGQRRLVELARCLAGPFDVLLLDEPSSGLDREETRQFGAVLTEVVNSRGCGILLVEHDMSLVLTVCSYIYVLDFGQLIFEGTAEEVASSQIVKAAYLGDEVVAAAASPALTGQP